MSGTAAKSGKTAERTAVSPRNGARIPVGAHPGNTGGKKGRSGRKPQAFRVFAASVATDPEFQQALKTAALDPDHPNHANAVKQILAYSEGLPRQVVEQTGEQTLRVVFASE